MRIPAFLLAHTFFVGHVGAQTPAAMNEPPACFEQYSDSTATHAIHPATFTSAGDSLRGDYYHPDVDGPAPAVVLMHGGGSNPRLLRDMPLFFAPRLAACGVGALVYDKRGTGESDGIYEDSTFDDFVRDAGRAAEYLASRPDIAPESIGIIGFSQGGRLAPVVAVRYSAVRFVASVSGPLTSVESTRLYALENSFRGAGVADSLVNLVMPFWERHLAAVAARDSMAMRELDDGTMELRDSIYPALIPPASDAIPRTGIYNSMGRDYTTELAGLHVPWLSVYGESDPVVPVRESVRLLEDRMRAAGNDRYTVHVEPGVGHSFINPDTGEQFVFEALVFEWLLDNLHNR